MTAPPALPPDAVEIVRREVGCTCDAHYSQGEVRSCQEWRQRTAERIVAALTQGASKRCACGAPERCWPDSETCAFMDTGYPWCRVCKANHRAPECSIDAQAGGQLDR